MVRFEHLVLLRGDADAVLSWIINSRAVNF